MLHLIIGILCIIGIGLIAHRLGICLVRAVKLTPAGQLSLFAAILFSGLWVGAYSVIAAVIFMFVSITVEQFLYHRGKLIDQNVNHRFPRVNCLADCC